MSAKLAYQINGQTIYNVYDASGSLIHIDKASAGQVTDYVSGPAGTLARITNDVVTYLHPDWCIFWFPKIAQGSAQAGTTKTGTIAWREQYTPFGEQLQNPAANDNLDGFTGHIKDKDTGLNYMQARYYDPVIGRFLSIDPVGFMDTGNPGMFNRYAYSFNDPINMLDADGRKPEHVQDRVNRGIRAAAQNPQAGIRVAAGAVAMSAAVVGVVAAGVIAAPAAAACTGACTAIAVGASAGAGFEGINQAQSGEFNPVKLGAAAAVGAAGGAGSLVGKQLATQAAGAFGAAALTGSTVEMLNQSANGTVDGVGVVTAGAKAGVGAALGAGAGNLAGRGIAAISTGAGKTGGAAAGAALGEVVGGTTMEILDNDR